MKINRFGAALLVLATCAAILSACGGDKNAPGGSSATGTLPAKVACGGKPTLK
ncbi:MAG: phosphate ABC transporter substrate-binding protein PstS, partial [Mycobacterium sp.]